MEKIHGNMLVLGLSSKFVSCKHKKHVSMYFLHLVLVCHYIVRDKGLLIF